MTKDDLIACVLDAHEPLTGESDLSPSNPRINEVLSALVRGILEGCPPGDVRQVLGDRGVRAVRAELLEKLAVAEGEMEKHWGRTLCARASLSATDLRDFTYWDSYRHLVRAELRSLPPGFGPGAGQSIAFVGAGPLPLSAVIMHLRTGLKVTCIDVDSHACSLAGELCRKAGLRGIDVRCADGTEHHFAHSPVVFIASLVREKRRVVERVRETCPQACVALRSAEGLRTLLYEPVDQTELAAMGCRFLGRTGHNPAVINTTLFYEVAPALRDWSYPRWEAAARSVHV